MQREPGPRFRSIAPFLALVTLAGTGCARVQQLDLHGVPQRTLAEVTADPSSLAAPEGGGEASPVVVHLAAGDRIPLTLRVAMPALHVEPGDNVLVFDREAYLYIVPGRSVLISPDGERWASPGDGRTIRQLFGVHHGTFQVGFGVREEGGAVATVALEAQ